MKKPAKVAKKAPTKPAKKGKAKPLKPVRPGEPILLSGGNPQIAKGYGDGPVQAYIAAAPGWKKETVRKLDRIIEKTVPGVRKAVKWNSPMYGMVDDYWFVSMHLFEKYIKVAFHKGVHLKPVPPDTSKQKEVRYYNIHEGKLDEAQFADWVKQASKLPGEKM
jgi:hypothetical protein